MRPSSEYYEYGGARFVTFMVYLSDVPLGGHTVFPQTGKVLPTPITGLRLSSKTQYPNVKKSDIDCLVIESWVVPYMECPDIECLDIQCLDIECPDTLLIGTNVFS